jgi:3-hydroxybutyryl-CoA dehydrogenase
VDRLIRPQFNLALRAIDNDLATPDDLETALKIGLGYRRGLLNMVMDSGLELHFERTSALFETYGEAKYAPPRSAVTAATRAKLLKGKMAVDQ